MTRSWPSSLANALAVAAVVAAISLVPNGLRRFVVLPPPFEYTAHSYDAERTPLCPGDELAFKTGVTVRRPPSQLRYTETIWDVKGGFTAVADTEPSYFNLVASTGSTRRRSYTLPATLPLGRDYWYVGVSQAESSEPQWFIVPFQTASDCP